MQLFPGQINEDGAPLPTGPCNGLKKAARNAENRIPAYQMTVVKVS